MRLLWHDLLHERLAAQEAGIPRKLAPTIGIAVDGRRVNRSEEGLAANVARLKAYKARLILFPRKPGQHKPGDSSKEDVEAFHKKDEEEGAATAAMRRLGAVMPIVDEARVRPVTEVKSKDMPKGEEAAYRKLRMARSDARLVGAREKRAKAKADEAAALKK